MSMINDRFFRYVSYTKWIFFVWAMIAMLLEVFDPTTKFVSTVGFSIFLMGIFLGLGSLHTSESLLKKSKKITKNNFKTSVLFLLAVIAITVGNSIFLFSAQHVNPALKPHVVEQLHNVAYGTLSLALGMLCTLKQLFDAYREAHAND